MNLPLFFKIPICLTFGNGFNGTGSNASQAINAKITVADRFSVDKGQCFNGAYFNALADTLANIVIHYNCHIHLLTYCQTPLDNL
jgi:hypothetical protein